MPFRDSLFRAFAGLALLALSGCTTAPEAHGGRYVVSAPRSPFYKYGPAQAFGADFALERGKKVTVIENSFGFSKVMTDDGQSGFMPTDDLAPAPPETASQETRTSHVASRRGRGVTGEETFSPPKAKASKVEPGLPLFDANDVPLPTNSQSSTPKP
jgi:hypothetical protein